MCACTDCEVLIVNVIALTLFLSLCIQDVDSAYLVKADLEDKVGSLTDEINFLRNIYEEVCVSFY